MLDAFKVFMVFYKNASGQEVLFNKAEGNSGIWDKTQVEKKKLIRSSIIPYVWALRSACFLKHGNSYLKIVEGNDNKSQDIIARI